MPDLVLRGGWVIDGAGAPPRRADIGVDNGLVVAIGAIDESAGTILDCSNRYLMPGFVDTHSHADAMIFTEETQLALLRQGITTIIAGQDGVSYAPGDGTYAAEYFAAIDGAHPSYRGGGVAALLASYGRAVPINVAYLVPHGTVRHEVMGRANRPPSDAELATMIALVADGMAAGAVGLSTGLDYTPGVYGSTAELIAVCAPVVSCDAVYVTHIRGGYETKAAAGMSEVAAICEGAKVAAHVSHYHGPPDLLVPIVDDMRSSGLSVTFDHYPYRAGCTLLAMQLLPEWLLAFPAAEAARWLADRATKEALLRDWMPGLVDRPYLGPGWQDRLTPGFIPATEFRWAEGMTLAGAAATTGVAPEEFALDLLAATQLAVNAVSPRPPGLTVDDLAALIRHPGHMVGSDGIYLGGHPHPRGWGTFARVLARHVQDRRDLSWPEVAMHLAGRPASRFGLDGRGRLHPGFAADIVVVDPDRVADRASYASPRVPADGIDDVLVNGVPVLRDGLLTGARPGRGLRHRERITR